MDEPPLEADPLGSVRLRDECRALPHGRSHRAPLFRQVDLCAIRRRPQRRAGRLHGIGPVDEIGIDASKHKPRTLEELEEWEGLNFDLIISLSPEAHHAALELTRTIAAEVEYWPTPDPTITQGSREQMLDAYRNIRDGLMYRIRTAAQAEAQAKGPDDGEGA